MGFLIVVMSIVLGVLVLVGGLQWLDGRHGPSRRKPLEPKEIPPAQLERLESAIGALEARLDDLQDQQRFLERLLADRPEPKSLPESRGDSLDEERSILFDTGRSDDEDDES